MSLRPSNGESLERLLHLAPGASMLAVLIAAGALAAQWFWYFAAPATAPPPPAREQIRIVAAAEGIANAHLLGIAPAGGIALSSLNVRLKGVFAGANASQGVAILNSGGRDESARVGGEIVPGVVLESVHGRHVVLRRNGVPERVNLEEWIIVAQAAPGVPSRAAPAAPPVPGAAPPAGSAPSPQPNPGRRFQRPEPYAPVGDVSAEPVQPPSAPPKPAAPRSEVPAQGLVVGAVAPGSVLERIGLQAGDVIRSVNGEPVASEADVTRIVQSRAMQGVVTAEVTRGGTTIPLSVNVGR